MRQNLDVDGRLIAEHAERALLGVMLLDPRAIQAAAILQPSDFALDGHKRLFVMIRRLAAEGPVDEVALLEELRRTRELEAVGGIGVLAGLTAGVCHVNEVGHYVKLLQSKARSRYIVNLCDLVSAKAIDGDDSTALLEELQTSALAQQSAVADLRSTPLSELVLPYLERLKEQRESGEALRGITTGIGDLDEITSGWRNGELTYVGALPGRGKTAAMVQWMYVAASAGRKVGFISLEMTRLQIMGRLATIQTGFHPSRFRDPATMNDSEWAYAQGRCARAGGLGDLPVEIYDRSNLRAGEVAAVARRMCNNGCELIFVDFIQRIRQEGRDSRESINHTSNMLAETCKALDVPFVVASQLARRDANPNRRPTMQDLRESGNLEQDAHNILLLYRPQSSAADGGQDLPPEWTGRDEIIVAKQREGLVGWVDATFDERSLTFKPRSTAARSAA